MYSFAVDRFVVEFLIPVALVNQVCVLICYPSGAVVALLFVVHDKHLWTCRDDQLT